MRRIRKYTSPILIITLCAAALAAGLHEAPPSRASAAKSEPAQGAKSSPHLRGRDAAKYLRESGLASPLASAAAAYVEQGKLAASDAAAQDNLGYSVAIDGNTAVVGAPYDQVGTTQRQGSVYVFTRAGTTWSFQQKLTASDGTNNDEFGYAVAITGDTVFVGRHNTQQLSNRTRGAVYVFTRSGSTWTQGPSLLSDDGTEGDTFGASLAVDGGTLVAAAPLKNNGSTFFQGAVYVFTGSGAAWTQQQKILAPDGGFANYFGYSVSVSGDTLIAGAPGQAGVDAASGRGFAYVFTRSGAAWSHQQKLQAGDGAAGDSFGFSVSVSGDTAVVGARLDTVGPTGAQGSAYVFTRAGAAWTEQQHLFGVEAIQRNDQFGYSVAVRGDTIAVGAPLHEILPSIANHGAVYVFTRTGTTWTRSQKLIHSDASADALGQAVAFDGSSIVAGAPAKNSARGAAYVFALDPNAADQLLASDLAAEDEFGYSVAVEGDTAVVGARGDDITGNASSSRSDGALYVFTRTGSAWAFQQKLTANDATGFDHLGYSVAINGNTIVGGAPLQGNLRGAAYVFTRTGATWAFQQKLTAADGANNDRYGWSVAVSGDTCVVGAPTHAVGGGERGAAYVYTRTGATWSLQTQLNVPGQSVGSQFGSSVALSNDTALVGATTEDSRGAAYFFTRTGSVWGQPQRIANQQNVQGGTFGRSVALSNDTALVGASQHTNGNGAVFVYVRGGSTWAEQQVLTGTDTPVPFDGFGESVALSGDTAVVGVSRKTVGNNSEQGAAYIFARTGSTWAQTGRLTAFDGRANDHFGFSVAVSGATAVVGAPSADPNGLNGAGAAYAFTLAGSQPPATTVQFSAATFTAGEATGAATITVTRTGATTGASTVGYTTVDDPAAVPCDPTVTQPNGQPYPSGAAYARCDYATSVDTLSFAAGEAQKTFAVPLINDAHAEGTETLTLRLVSPAGAALGAQTEATLSITDDDAAGQPNPTFTTAFFVRQHYLDFLSREPEAGEPWSAILNNCPAGDTSCDRVAVSAAFFGSPEFRLKGFYAFNFYRASFGRLPTYDEIVVDMRQVTGATPEEVYQKKAAFASAFAQRQEFTTAYPQSQTPQQYVDALMSRYSLQSVRTNNPATPDDDAAKVTLTRADMVNGLTAQTLTRAQVLRAVVQSDEVSQAESNRAFVAMQYYGYLRRAPEEKGFNDWLNTINANPSDFRNMVNGFVNSEEYKRRFGKP